MKASKLLFLVILGLFMFSKTANSEEWKKTMAHETIAMEKEWLNTNRPLDAEDLKGRIILLDFWTYCCINCIHVIPDLKHLEKVFGDKLTVIGVHSAKFNNEKDKENIRSAVLRYGIHHPVVNDANFKIWSRFGVRAWPTLVLINPEGKIEAAYSGEGNKDELETDINGLIKKYKSINTKPLPIVLEKEEQPKRVLNFPSKIAYAENFRGKPALFISDSGHNRILGVRLNGKTFLSVGSGAEGAKNGSYETAEFNSPHGILYRNDSIYVADTGNHMIRRIDLNEKKVETIAGTGEQGFLRSFTNKDAKKTPLASPWDLEFYPTENEITIAMAGTHQLWVYDIKNGKLNVLAGNGRESIDDGAYPFNSLSQPSGLSAFGGKLYFVDSETSSLRVLENGQITTLIGTGLFDFGFVNGKKNKALMQHSIGVYADQSGVFIADTYNHAIRRYDPAKEELFNVTGKAIRGDKNGKNEVALFNEPNDVLKVGEKIYIADTNNHSIKMIDYIKGEVSTLPILPPNKSEEMLEKYQEDLPNVIRKTALNVKSGAGVKARILLEDGWKINKEAPNFLSLYQIQNTNFVFVKNYSSKDIKENEIELDELEPERQYKLQGTLYYCKEEDSANCFIQSHDQILRSSPTYDNDLIKIKLENPFGKEKAE